MVYFGSRFAAIAVTEGILIGLGQPVLEHFHRVDLYPQWITAIVGVHFIPLGRLFRVGAFYLTGLALLLAALGSFLLPAGQSRGIATATGSGFSLWITTLMLLKADWRSGTGNTQGP